MKTESEWLHGESGCGIVKERRLCKVQCVQWGNVQRDFEHRIF